MRLKYDNCFQFCLISAFKFNWRRYNETAFGAFAAAAAGAAGAAATVKADDVPVPVGDVLAAGAYTRPLFSST